MTHNVQRMVELGRVAWFALRCEGRGAANARMCVGTLLSCIAALPIGQELYNTATRHFIYHVVRYKIAKPTSTDFQTAMAGVIDDSYYVRRLDMSNA